MSPVRATYRLQLRNGVTFDDAAALVDYLADLGVSHLYLSPCQQAVPGSTHGYDIVDPTSIDDTLGGDEGLARLRDAAAGRGLGLVLDVVPNHVAVVSPANRWWWDVLMHGPDSRYAACFDIDWRPGRFGQPQVVVPVLGAPLFDELTGGDVRLLHEPDWRIQYHEHAFPLRPDSLSEAGLDASDPDQAVAAAGADPGRLWSVLLRQHYALVDWRRANTELNYRRFFDITTLGGVRVEDPDVFELTHARVLELVRDGTLDGLRIDHPDGLRDPAGYVARLRSAAPDAWIVVEKILEAGEERPTDWPIDGTVGYAFANRVLGLFVDPDATAPLTGLYQDLVGDTETFGAAVAAAKRQVLTESFDAELGRLVTLLSTVAEEAGLIATADEIRVTLIELIVAFPVYRTYVRPGQGEISASDRRVVDHAVATARLRLEDDEILDLIAETLTLALPSATWEPAAPADEFVARFQQLTGPVMAKGTEDTAFYRYLRFIALNEVGGDPATLGTTVGDFHAANLERSRDWPATMLTTSTHDTKRSEDVRARLAVVSELPDDWIRAVTEWRDLAAPLRGPVTTAHEYLTFQTLVGTWPISPDRLVDYLVKAAREGKQATHWLAPDEDYEAALETFTRGLLDDEGFVASLERFVEQILEPGRLNALAQTLLRVTSPGVPDTYQGTELWDLHLVDPDNRRPVDFGRRSRLLADLQHEPEPEDVLAGMAVGVPKLWVLRQALAVRRDRPAAFGPEGGYAPVHAWGGRRRHVVAFLRGGDVLTVAPRLVVGLGGPFLAWDWTDTTLPVPRGRWRDVMSDTVHDVGDDPTPVDLLLNRFPVALLTRDDTKDT